MKYVISIDRRSKSFAIFTRNFEMVSSFKQYDIEQSAINQATECVEGEEMILQR